MPKIHRVGSPSEGSPHIFIATGGYDFHPNYTAALARSLLQLPLEGIAIDVCLISGHCHVDDCRNSLISEFLLTKCTDLVFIDNDVGWEPEGLIQLVRHRCDLVAGVYPLKQMEEDYPVLPEQGVELYADEDGLVEVRGVPAGFLKLSRHLIETMVAAESRKYRSRAGLPGQDPETILFERTYENSRRYSGDYAFCRKWRAMGGKVYVDPHIVLSHHGEFEWSGTLGDFWKRRHGVKDMELDAAFDAAVAALRAGGVSAQVMHDLWAGWKNKFHQSDIELAFACYLKAREASGPILECGSGLSTIVMAMANPTVTIHSLEHDPIWATKTRDALERHGITNVTLHCHALRDYPEGRWYDIKGLPDLSWSFVLLDGPPRVQANRALLFDVLGDAIGRAPVLMDDAADPGQLDALKKWSAAKGRAVTTLGEGRLFAVSIDPATAETSQAA